ncbi:MAG: hypothetical protein K0Q73_2650 [Paenibacillus sp.]|jgi:hypothetical protein|nr:hypothetical protein [Paenibacillus sp.]
MFNKTLSEILGIAGTILSIGIIVFGAIWGLLSGLNISLTDIFNNITMPS